jgi:PAS domain-containing protein
MYKASFNLSPFQRTVNIPISAKFGIAVLAGLITVFVIDPLDPSTVSTPFCLGIILMGLALRQPFPLVVSVSLLYCVLTVYALIHFHSYIVDTGHISPHPYFWLFQRCGLFFVLSGLSMYLTYYRTDTERILSRLRTILSKLPAPVILSDASGNIVYANDAVLSVLNQRPSDMVGRSYFDFLLTEKMKGKSIRAYFDLFEKDTNGMYELEVSPFDHAHKRKAQLICLGTGSNRVMITVLQSAEAMVDQPILS